jgi:hypothetical protein
MRRSTVQRKLLIFCEKIAQPIRYILKHGYKSANFNYFSCISANSFRSWDGNRLHVKYLYERAKTADRAALMSKRSCFPLNFSNPAHNGYRW